MEAFKKSILPIMTFARIDIKRAFRDKVALFFIFLFPLIFLFVFGTIFGREGGVSFNVVVVNNSQTQFARDFAEQLHKTDVLKVDKKISTVDAAKEKMTRGELDATIVLPVTFGEVSDKGYPTGQAEILYSQSNEQGGQTLRAVLQEIFASINNQFVPTETPFSVEAKSTIEKGLTRFDYVFAGLLGFSAMSLGIFGPTNVFPRLKTRGVLRRYHTTPLKVWQYFLGNMISTAFVGILSIATMFTTAMLVFNLSMRGDYASFISFVVLSVTVLFGIGLAVGGWAKNENQAAPLANLVTFPMMFLSGTFFPRYAMPEWLQHVSGFLPLTPVIDGVRLIVTEGKTIFEILPQVGILCAWGILVYAIAFRVFRWE